MSTTSKPLDGRAAIVTGGAGGIGRASALELARQGARVVVADIAEGGEEVVREIGALGGEAVFQRTDVTSPEALEALTRRCVEAFGRLDVMFNNAGIGEGAALLDWSPEQYRRVIAVNQEAVFYGIQAAARVMRDAGRGGVIINTGSIYGELASLYTIGYQAAKAAVAVMTKVAALELGSLGIRVVNVAPGVVDTPMVDGYRRMGVIDAMAKKHVRGQLIRPEEIARVVAYLASDAASCINGTTVFADDGYSTFK